MKITAQKIVTQKIAAIFLLAFSMAAAAAGQQDAVPKNDQTRLDQNLVIKKKGSPGYSDSAKEAEVDGKVRLKVTFKSDGTVGDVVYHSGTAFKRGRPAEEKLLTTHGLVEKAIKAARRIKFKPAMRNGQAVTVSRIVEYRFNLY